MSEIKLLSQQKKAKELGKQPITIIRHMKSNKIIWCKVPISNRKWFFPKFLDFLVEKANLIEELKKI